MSVKYLYYTEDANMGGSLSAAHAIPVLDQFLKMYGGQRMCIHPHDADYPASAKESYATLVAAQEAYPGHTWFYLDAHAARFIDGLMHPADDVVYVVGHDLTGFAGEAKNGESFKLRVLPATFDGHAMIVLSVVCSHRWEQLPWQ